MKHLAHAAGVVGGAVGQPAGPGRAAHDHRRQAEVFEERYPRILGPEVDEDDAVNPALGPPVAEHHHLFGGVVHHLQHQRDPARRQLPLDSGEKIREIEAVARLLKRACQARALSPRHHMQLCTPVTAAPGRFRRSKR
jgi:hypothetical protein